MSIQIKEFRHLANGQDSLVDVETVPTRHTKKAARIFSEFSLSLRESGLRGRVDVRVDGKLVEFPYIDESGRLVI